MSARLYKHNECPCVDGNQTFWFGYQTESAISLCWIEGLCGYGGNEIEEVSSNLIPGLETSTADAFVEILWSSNKPAAP